jgi:DNA-binding MarR family transcriptional regulator
VTSPVPLARLFAMAYRDLIDDLHERLRQRGWHDVRPAYGFVLLAARDGPTSATALAGLMGVSKQAASKLVDAMAASGYVTRSDGADDGRQRPVSLTARGHDLLAAVETIYADLEAGWAGTVGRAEIEQVRSVLVRVLAARHGGVLPPVRPTW